MKILDKFVNAPARKSYLMAITICFIGMFLFFTNMSYESLMYQSYNQGDPSWNEIGYADSVRKKINLI